MGVNLLSPLRPVLGNDEPLIELLGNALTFERVLQRPAPSHLWATDRPRMPPVFSNETEISENRVLF